MTKPLTKIQKETLEYLARASKVNGYMPTIREIAAHFKVASSAAFSRVKALKAKGAIRIKPRSSRGIVIVGK